MERKYLCTSLKVTSHVHYSECNSVTRDAQRATAMHQTTVIVRSRRTCSLLSLLYLSNYLLAEQVRERWRHGGQLF